MKTVVSEKAPAAIGPYSQAVDCGDFIFLSGQLGIDPISGVLPEGGIAAETKQVCENVKAILTEAGLSFANVIKTTCFLSDMADFAAFNAVYADYFVSLPARSCVAVKSLPKGGLCEIEVVAKR